MIVPPSQAQPDIQRHTRAASGAWLAPGVDGVLRVQVAGKTLRELKGLPRDGMLYPIVCMCERYQSYTMVALP
jgi:hypothetical protein